MTSTVPEPAVVWAWPAAQAPSPHANAMSLQQFWIDGMTTLPKRQ
jgi:hypothetical protein